MVRWSEDDLQFLLNKRKTKPSKKPKSKLVVSGYKSNVKGWRTIGGKKYYFKSLWEIQYAQTLEWYKKAKVIKDWEYEPQLFEFPKEKYRTGPFYYKPDFRVLELDGTYSWKEVKGYMTKDAKKKMTRFAKHFPEEPMEIINKNWFMRQRKRNLHKIIGWEILPSK